MSADAAVPANGAGAGRLRSGCCGSRAGHRGRARAADRVTAILEPRFIEPTRCATSRSNAAILAILAVGQTLVIITQQRRPVDGVDPRAQRFLAGDLLSKHPGLALPVVFLLGSRWAPRAVSLTGSLSPGGGCRRGGDVGTLYVFRGLAFLWTDGRQVNAETLRTRS